MPGRFNSQYTDYCAPKQAAGRVIRDLATCARDGGIPPESLRILSCVGKWLERNGGHLQHPALRCDPLATGRLHAQRPTLYMHVHFRPGETLPLGGLRTKVKSARMLAMGRTVRFTQEEWPMRFTGLPQNPPDDPDDDAGD